MILLLRRHRSRRFDCRMTLDSNHSVQMKTLKKGSLGNQKEEDESQAG